ncbi:MAG: PAS domain-containing protein [Sulfitobacter sp.]|nr:PAS domain-containing protein [Sulfitobacter sp.]
MKDSITYEHFDMIAAPVFVLEVSAEGQPVYAAMNSYARKQAGRPLSDYLGRTALEVYPMSYGRSAYDHHCDVLKSGEDRTYELDLPINGKVAAIRTTLRTEKDDNGRILRLIGSSVDMTTEKHARDAKLEFDTLSSEMEQFVAFAAHDLRAPMRNISVLTAMMREDCGTPDKDQLEIIDLIENIAVQSMDLISDVLSHAETVSTKTNETVFSFPALCHSICETLDPQGRHRFSTCISTLKADRTAIQIALRNIAENALKHGNRDRLEIDISVQQGMPGMIEITLSDNGKGFSDAALKIMNGGRFRADSGYGLFGIKRLISSRGGTLIARNLPNEEGAIVRFSIPGTLVGNESTLGGSIQELRVPPRSPLITDRFFA